MMVLHVFAEARVKGLTVTLGEAEWCCIQRKRVSPFIVKGAGPWKEFGTAKALATFVRQYRPEGMDPAIVRAEVQEAHEAIDSYEYDPDMTPVDPLPLSAFLGTDDDAAPDTIRDIPEFAMVG